MASPSIAIADRPSFAARFRIIRRLAVVVVLLCLCVPFHFLWRAFRAKSPWPRLFLGSVAKAAGVDVEVRGTPLPGRVLFIANHLSWIDILLLAGETGSAFIAKGEMEEWPLLGWLAVLNNTVFVDRDARAGVAGQAAAVRAALETGQPLTLFAEGTTNDGHALLPFRSSLIAAVTPPPSGVGIQPVAIDFGPIAADIAWVGDESVGHNAAGVLARRGRMRVILHFLSPLAHEDFCDRKAIAAHSRDAIAAALRHSPR
jgi:1-acyl-sn-glycerol-3-phosphate acyltransferase